MKVCNIVMRGQDIRDKKPCLTNQLACFPPIDLERCLTLYILDTPAGVLGAIFNVIDCL